MVENGDVQSSEKEREEENLQLFPRLSPKWLKDHCRKHGLYQTPHLNEVLYLQHQGFRNIESLEEYTHVRSLWLDHNHFTQIGMGLVHMQAHLKCLFLQNNSLKDLQGIEHLKQLVILDVSHNQLQDTSGLEHLPLLTTLYIGHNKLSQVSSIESLRFCENLNTLDLSRNKLGESQALLVVLKSIAQLRVLYLHGNPVVRDIDPYRTRLILHCENLTYLDDRPIRETDRACAVAWHRGGLKAMEEEKQKQKDQELKELMRNVEGVLKRFGNKTQAEPSKISEEKEEFNAVDLSKIILEFPSNLTINSY